MADIDTSNLASEATLRRLLIQLNASDRNLASQVQNLIRGGGAVGVDAGGVQRELTGFETKVAKTGAFFGGMNQGADQLNRGFKNTLNVTESLTKGTGLASETLGHLAGMGGPIGLVASALQKAAQFQEQNLDAYRKLAASGINLSGSLTDIRMSASRTYMTMDQFTNVMKNNSEAMAQMGTTANDGAQSFIKLNIDLQRSKMGDQLRSLGFTGEQASQSLANYIQMTGGRTKEEMKNTTELTASAGAYMKNLDALSQITGKSKEALEAQLKEQSMNAAFQAKLQTMDAASREKAMAGLQVSLAQGGKGAGLAFMGELLGVGAGMTKEGAEFAGMFGEAAQSVSALVAGVTDTTKTVTDQMREGVNLGVQLSSDVKAMGMSATALIMQGNTAVIGAQQTANRLNAQGIQNSEQAIGQLEAAMRNQTTRETSQAAQAAATQKAMQDLGTKILEFTIPSIDKLNDWQNSWLQKAPAGLDKIFNGLNLAGDWLKDLVGLKKSFDLLILATGGLTALFIILKGILGVMAISELLKGRGGGGIGLPSPTGGGGGGRGGPTGGTPRTGGGAKGIAAILAAIGLSAGVDMLASKVADGKNLTEEEKARDEENWEKMDALQKVMSTLPRSIEYVGDFLAPNAANAARRSRLNYETDLYGTSAMTTAAAKSEETTNEQDTPTNVNLESLLQEMNNLNTRVASLNNQTAEVVRFIRETADNTKRTYEATRRLDGNLFPSPS